MRRTRRLFLGTATAALLVTLAACAGSGSGNDGLADAPQAAQAGDAGAMDFAGGAPEQGSPDVGGAQPGDIPADLDRQIIITASMTIEASAPILAADKATAIVVGAGGYVAARNDDAGTSDGPGMVTLTLKVPSSDVDGAAAQLKDLGDVLSETWRREDVTATIVDLDARIETLRTSIGRLQDMMQTAGKVEDLIKLESELTSRQADLESMLAQRTQLGRAVDFATIDLLLTPPAEPSAVERTGFVGALASGWNALVTAGRAVVVAAGYVLPWAAVAAVIVVPIVVWRRRMRATRPATPLATSQAATPPAPPALVPDAVASCAQTPPPSAPGPKTGASTEAHAPSSPADAGDEA